MQLCRVFSKYQKLQNFSKKFSFLPRATLQKYRKNTNIQYTKRLKNAPQRRLSHTHTRTHILKSQTSTLSVMTAGCLCRAAASQLLQCLLLFLVLVAALCSILQGGSTLQCSQETNHRAKGKKCSDKVAVATCKLRERQRQKRHRELHKSCVSMCVCLSCLCVCDKSGSADCPSLCSSSRRRKCGNVNLLLLEA